MKKPTTTLKALSHFPRLIAPKHFVFIASAQRSGSTLLKALLAVAPDVSHLPEVPFHLYSRRNAWQLKTLSDKPIIVLKKPSWPNETNYPQLPPVGAHKIVLLIRHPYETLVSTGKMYEAMNPDFWEEWSYERMLYDYWLPTYEGMLARGLHLKENSHIVRYEALVEDPVKHTAALYKFIGSERQTGTDTYQNRSESWTFMTDDGSDKIKSLKVQPSFKPRENKHLLQIIQREPRVTALIKVLGYGLSKNEQSI